MPCPRPTPAAPPRPGRPAFEVADVFRAHGEAFRQGHALSPDQHKVMRAIEACRTPLLGGHVDSCASCGYCHPAYNSCRNRHCPKCPAIPQARWIAARTERMLPTHYYHCVFTLPSALRSLVRHNRAVLFDLLLRTAGATLLELGRDPKRLGAQLGVTTVLHSWTRDLRFHPHAHCIVTGGGLDAAGQRWVPARKKFLFPVKVMGALFRGKFLAALRRLYERGELTCAGSCTELSDPKRFRHLVGRLYETEWVTYSKPTFRAEEHVIRYLGRYTHRVAISNQRIVAFDDRGVTFVTKGKRTETLAPDVFIGRFLQHVLPAGFAKIRHYGLHASSNATTRLAVARVLLQSTAPVSPTPAVTSARPTWQELVHAWTGQDPTRCPRCHGPLRRWSLDDLPPGLERRLRLRAAATQDTS